MGLGPETTNVALYSREELAADGSTGLATDGLVRVLTERGVDAIGTSVGDGLPQQVVFVPSARTGSELARVTAAEDVVFVFTPSYLARSLEDPTGDGSGLLRPMSPQAVGTVRRPVGTPETVQFARSLRAAAIPGEYVLSTTDPRIVQAFADAAADAGLGVSRVYRIDRFSYIATNPPVVVSLLLLSGGLVSFGVLTVVLLRVRARELGVRLLVGGTPFALSKQTTGRWALSIAAGVAVGFAGVTAVPSLVRSAAPRLAPDSVHVAMLGSGVLACLLTVLATSMMVASTTVARGDARG